MITARLTKIQFNISVSVRHIFITMINDPFVRYTKGRAELTVIKGCHSSLYGTYKSIQNSKKVELLLNPLYVTTAVHLGVTSSYFNSGETARS